MTASRIAWAVLAAVAVAFAATVVWLIALDAPIEWDEAVYAGRARAWVTDLPATGWGDHRPPGVPLLSTPLLAVTEHLPYVRGLGLLAGLALLAAVAWSGWVLRGPLAGAIGALLVAGVVPVLTRSAQLLTDVAAAAGIVATAAVLWWQLGDRETPDRRLALAPAAAAAAFYVRYGSLAFTGLLLATAVVLWWPTLRRHRGVALQAAGVGVALAVPHLVHAVVATGDPLGILRLADELAPAGSFGGALTDYVTDLDAFGPLAPGLLAVALLVLGVVAVGLPLGDRQELADLANGAEPVAAPPDRAGPVAWGADRRAAALLLVPAVGGTLLVARSSGALPRLLIPAVVLLLVGLAAAVADRLDRVSRTPGSSSAPGTGSPSGNRLTRPGGWAWAAAALIAVAGVAALGLGVGEAGERVRRARDQRAPIREAALVVARDAGDRSCAALAREVPIVTWYAGCPTEHFGFPPEPGRADLLTGDVRYLILHRSERGEPTGPDRAAYLDLAEPQPIAVVDDPVRDSAYEVYRLR